MTCTKGLTQGSFRRVQPQLRA